MLGHILDKLLEEGVHKASFVIGHLGDQIKEYVIREYPSIKADFIEQEKNGRSWSCNLYCYSNF